MSDSLVIAIKLVKLLLLVCGGWIKSIGCILDPEIYVESNGSYMSETQC